MNKPNNPPAFPRQDFKASDGAFFLGEKGMTLLDYFAAKAMPAISQVLFTKSASLFGKDLPDNYAEIVAKGAYEQAQAMLKEREKHL